MSALKLSTAQAALVALITAAQANAVAFPDLAGVPLAVEAFNSDAADATINAALDTGGPGLCIYSVSPWSARLEKSITGTDRFQVSLTVFVLENPTQNGDALTGGLGRDPLKVIEALWQAVCNKPSKGGQDFHVSDPLDPVPEGSGMRIWATSFELPVTFKP